MIDESGMQRTVWLDDEEAGWQHNITYVDGTNIVRTRATSDRHPFTVESVDYAVPGEPLLRARVHHPEQEPEAAYVPIRAVLVFYHHRKPALQHDPF